MKPLLFSLALLLLTPAQSVTRNVICSWTASTSPGVTGYNVYRAPQTPTPVFVALNQAPLTGTSFTDTTAVIGSMYLYAVTSITPACTATTAITTPCGESEMSNPTTVPIPPRPTSGLGGIVVIVQ
jgi:hypothetical protein